MITAVLTLPYLLFALGPAESDERSFMLIGGTDSPIAVRAAGGSVLWDVIGGGRFPRYADVYARAIQEGREVLVAVDQSEAACRRLADESAVRGRLFAVAGPDDGFEPGVHELVVLGDTLFYRTQFDRRPDQHVPRARPARVPAAGVLRGCGPGG